MAGVIKAAARSDAGVTGAAQAFHFQDVGESYVARVRGEAARIIAEARQEAARIKAKAVEEGREAAIQAAQASLRGRLDQQLTSVLAALGQAAETVRHSRHAWQQHWEQHAVELACAIAERICRAELRRQPQITLGWVREALELASGNAEVSLRLNADDYATLATHVESITKQMAGLGNVKIAADPAISAGGCRVDTEFGSLDLQLEQQLARIAEELLN